MDWLLDNATLSEKQMYYFNGSRCPYCGNHTELIDSIKVYKESYGLIYYCAQDAAWVGCHKGSDMSFGTLAKKELRDLRHSAHLVFDPLWKKKKELTGKSTKYVRGKAYNWMAKLLGIEQEAAHIGYLGIQDCQKLIEECKKHYDTPEKIAKRESDIKFNKDVWLFNMTDYELEIKEFTMMNICHLEIFHPKSGKKLKYYPKDNTAMWESGKRCLDVGDIELFLEKHFK